MLPKIGCQYRAVAGMITPVCTWRTILAQTLAANTCFRNSKGPMMCRTFGWRSVNVDSRQRPASSAQHLTHTNGNTGPVIIADCWLPRLGQYFAVLSTSAIRTWAVTSIDFLYQTKVNKEHKALSGAENLFYPGGHLLLAWYRASTVSGFLVLAGYGLDP